MTILADGGLSGGQVAGLIIAVFWGVLVCFLAYVLVKLGKVIGETGKLITGVADQTVPLLGEVTTTVVQVNAELSPGRHDRRRTSRRSPTTPGPDRVVLGDRRVAGHQGGGVLLRRAPRHQRPA